MMGSWEDLLESLGSIAYLKILTSITVISEEIV